MLRSDRRAAVANTCVGRSKAGIWIAAGGAWDAYMDSPTDAEKAWMVSHYRRACFYPHYSDSRTPWFSKGMVYVDAYALYVADDAATIAAHPDWVLKDGSNNMLYIPWGCSGGVCPQYAGDFGNSDFRSFILSRIDDRLSGGSYAGIFLDDVNMDFKVSDGTGTFVNPIDPRTSSAMTEENWRKYMCEFMELIRATYPSKEICHNSLYWAGGASADGNTYVARQLAAADYVDLERGFNDDGITGGGGTFGWETIMSYIDHRHAAGTHVLLFGTSETNAAMCEYQLACYFLINNGLDCIGTNWGMFPDSWWTGFDTKTGFPLGDRYTWSGVWRRDFSNGMALVNEPGASTADLTLPATYIDTGGNNVGSVSLAARTGAVLRLS